MLLLTVKGKVFSPFELLSVLEEKPRGEELLGENPEPEQQQELKPWAYGPGRIFLPGPSCFRVVRHGLKELFQKDQLQHISRRAETSCAVQILIIRSSKMSVMSSNFRINDMQQ